MNTKVIILLVWLATCIGSAWLGWDYRDGKVAAEKLAVANEQKKLADAAELKANGLELELSALRTAHTVTDRIITKEVARYVQVTPPALRCTLPGTWRLRHDAAATGMSPDPGAGSVALGTDTAVEDATALETVADNYATARECLDKLAGWQQRYRTIEQP